MDALGAKALQELGAMPHFPNSIWVQFGLLFQRSARQQSRDRMPMVGGPRPSKETAFPPCVVCWHGRLCLHQSVVKCMA